MIWVWAGSGGRDATGTSRSSGTGKAGERAGTRVLVVDDDPSILDTVTSILSSEGFDVMAARGGEQALGLLSSWHPTLVLLDMRMPIMDGWTFAEQLQARGVQIPLVVMTAARDAQQWAAQVGATAYLAKPFDLDAMLATVDRLCPPCSKW